MYRIVYEDDYLIGVDKTAVIPCLRQGDKAGLSDEVLLEFPQLKYIPECGFTHRLDNETLGIILVAKTKEYYEAIRGLFYQKMIMKTYHARVTGILEANKGIIGHPIAHSKKSDKKMIAVKDGYRIYRGHPRHALTEWTVLKQTESNSDLELKTKTGARHQIRVHLQSIAHPICGDNLYGKDEKTYPSLMLISKSINFTCPVRDSKMKLESLISLDTMFSDLR